VTGVTGANLKKRIEEIMNQRVALRLTVIKKAALAVAATTALAAPIVLGMIDAPAMRAQSPPSSTLRFEVASIKPADPSARPGRMGASITTSPGQVVTRAASLKDLIEAAYAIEGYQVSGGPGWLDSARFDVQAKPANAAGREQLLLMLRPLLADRFKLAFHRETRELAVYALVVAKNGPKFHRLTPGAESAPGKVNRLGRNIDLPWFARYLTRFGSDRPVIDKTGLTGSFDLDLDMEKISLAAADAAGGSPTIGNMFEATANAIEGRLGLKLMPTKAPSEVLAIDRAKRPSAN
jgi:bla regulator protein blaR1